MNTSQFTKFQIFCGSKEETLLLSLKLLEILMDNSALLADYLGQISPSFPLQPHFLAKNDLYRVQKYPP